MGPSHDVAQQAESRLIIWLDHAHTDNDCQQEEKDRANFNSYQCLETEKTKIEVQLRKVFSRRSNLQENVCNVLKETVGVCLKTELPQCFSEREIDFIKKNMAEDFKEIFTAMEEMLGSNVQFSVSKCSVWSEDSLFSSGALVHGHLFILFLGIIVARFY